MILTPPDDDLAPRAAQSAFEEILSSAIAPGGTVSGEHGIGLLKRGGMQRELQTEVLAIQLALKNMFDPMDLFNPGKITGTPAVPS